MIFRAVLFLVSFKRAFEKVGFAILLELHSPVNYCSFFSANMPDSTPSLEVFVCHKARDVPSFVFDALRANEVNSNVILPILLKCLEKERAGHVIKDHLWIVVYYRTLSSIEVQIVLSCTDGLTGKYPIFLFTPLPSILDRKSTIYSALLSAARELSANVNPRRVFSVFGPEVLSRTFASIWTLNTKIQLAENPFYYLCKISYLTQDTLVQRELPIPPNHVGYLRPAVDPDLESVARLCFLFAADSVCLFCISERLHS